MSECVKGYQCIAAQGIHSLPLPKLQGNLSQGLHTLAKLSCIRCTGITQEVTSVDPLRKTNNNFKKILILMKD